MSADTTVFTEPNERGWWRVRVRYPSATKPTTLVAVRTPQEATTAAQGYAVLHGWTYVPTRQA